MSLITQIITLNCKYLFYKAFFSGIIKYHNVGEFVRIERTFIPSNNSRISLLKQYQSWKKTQKRCFKFYN